MAVQRATNLDNKPFVLSGEAKNKSKQTVVQDGGRSGDMVENTLMSHDPATSKWTSFTNEAATDGTQIPTGILARTLLEADIIAGDIVDVPIIVGGPITIDSAKLVIENSKTLATVVNVPTNLNKTVEELLRLIGIFTESTVDITETA